jgi:hypothetical protein
LCLSLSLSLSLFLVAPNLEHRASVKCCVSLQFLNRRTVGRTHGRGISPSQGHYLHRINADRHQCLEWDSNPQSQCSSGRRQYCCVYYFIIYYLLLSIISSYLLTKLYS